MTGWPSYEEALRYATLQRVRETAEPCAPPPEPDRDLIMLKPKGGGRGGARSLLFMPALSEWHVCACMRYQGYVAVGS
jgi:hypothetical protein